jgi:hypothetical protein
VVNDVTAFWEFGTKTVISETAKILLTRVDVEGLRRPALLLNSSN